jgi:malate dehydrogenase
MVLDPPLFPWLKASLLHLDVLSLIVSAGAEFAEYVIEAVFGGKKVKTVQAYVDLNAEAGGEGIKKEIGSDLGYFSVNITLGVSTLTK